MNTSLTEMHSASSTAAIPWAHVGQENSTLSQILKRSRRQMLERSHGVARMTTTVLPGGDNKSPGQKQPPASSTDFHTPAGQRKNWGAVTQSLCGLDVV